MDVFDRIWDRGVGVFEKWADLEIRETELELESQLAINRLQFQALQQPQTSGFLPSSTTGGGLGISMSTVLLVAGAGVGIWFLARKA